MVTWSGPALTEESSRVRISGISGTQLEITDLRSEDEGEYSCFCNGKEGTAYLEVTSKFRDNFSLASFYFRIL